MHIGNCKEQLKSAFKNFDFNGDKNLSDTYDTIAENIILCSKSFPKKKYRKYMKPYWSIELSQCHEEMKQAREVWCRAGRPRGINHKEYANYKSAKTKFRKLHRAAIL
jgi:hypothetical protein